VYINFIQHVGNITFVVVIFVHYLTTFT
jgi:hypothetical protein